MYIQTHINQHSFKTKVLKTPGETAMGMMGKKFDGKFSQEICQKLSVLSQLILLFDIKVFPGIP